MYSGNVKITAIGELYKGFVIVSFVSYGQITHPSPVVLGQVVIERNISLLFSGELHSDCYDTVLTAERKGGSCIFDRVCFYRKPLLNIFPLISLQINWFPLDSRTVCCIFLF